MSFACPTSRGNKREMTFSMTAFWWDTLIFMVLRPMGHSQHENDWLRAANGHTPEW